MESCHPGLLTCCGRCVSIGGHLRSTGESSKSMSATVGYHGVPQNLIVFSVFVGVSENGAYPFMAILVGIMMNHWIFGYIPYFQTNPYDHFPLPCWQFLSLGGHAELSRTKCWPTFEDRLKCGSVGLHC